MPIYEYRCQSCGHELEAIQKMADAPLTDCPECGQAGLTKKISAAAFRLKGGGWYETDFKSGDKKRNLAREEAGGDKSDSKGEAKAGEGKSENKSESKTPAKDSTPTGGKPDSKAASA